MTEPIAQRIQDTATATYGRLIDQPDGKVTISNTLLLIDDLIEAVTQLAIAIDSLGDDRPAAAVADWIRRVADDLGEA